METERRFSQIAKKYREKELCIPQINTISLNVRASQKNTGCHFSREKGGSV
uniref:Uncharacterized protein n=1 Tax=Anguilla anguilla TaxID=7936 RepID=A0A0E9RIX7_ANGAN